MAVKYIPEGCPTVCPYLTVRGVPKVIDFIQRVLDGHVSVEMPGPDGQVMHAEVRVGDSLIMMGEAPSDAAVMPGILHVYVPDVDAVYQRALEAGATSVREPADQFYGDRSGGVKDAAGNQWWLSTHIEDVTPEEMRRRMSELGT